MKIRFETIALGACVACVFGARAARADVLVTDVNHDRVNDVGIDPWDVARPASGIGVGLSVGGGIMGFTSPTVRDSTSALGGLWDVHATFGTYLPIALELDYVGAATHIASPIAPVSSTLVSTTFEGDVRVNIMPHALWNPYVFVGLGWQHFSIDNSSFSLSDTGIKTSDDVMDVPVGAGVMYRMGSWLANVRGTFRSTQNSNLILEAPTLQTRGSGNTFAPMHSWEASLSLGYEF